MRCDTMHDRVMVMWLVAMVMVVQQHPQHAMCNEVVEVWLGSKVIA